MNQNDIIIETIARGNSLKVTAIDTVTGQEASIIAPRNTSEKQRETLAIRKLNYLKAKLAGKTPSSPEGSGNY